MTDKNDPTVDELKAGWLKTSYLADLEKITKQLNKHAIISEIGYASLDGYAKKPGNDNKEEAEDLQEQADCYQAAFENLLIF